MKIKEYMEKETKRMKKYGFVSDPYKYGGWLGCRFAFALHLEKLGKQRLANDIWKRLEKAVEYLNKKLG